MSTDNGTHEVVLCGAAQMFVRCIIRCPIEKVRRRVVMADPGGYWSPIWTCCGCGDSWGDGELMERPFRRGWRAEAKARARANYARGVTRAEWQAWRRADLDSLIRSAS